MINYELLNKYGEEMYQNIIKPDDSFHECWKWIGKINQSGYGVLNNGMFAHRIAYLIRSYRIPDGWEIDHLCRNRVCVNPHHLEAVPKEINQARKNFMKTLHEQEKR